MNGRTTKEARSGSTGAISRNGLRTKPSVPTHKKSSPVSVSFADIWEQIAGHASPSLYPPRVQFVEQGSDSSEIYFVRRGIVKLQSIDRGGRETIVGLKSTGGLVGTDAAIMCKPHVVSAVTVTECSLQRFPTRQFCDLIRQHHDLSWYVHQISATELSRTTEALVEVKSYTANIRLKRLVLELVPELNEPGLHNAELRLPFKHWEIAQMLGVTPEHLSRLLRRLEKEGFFNRKGAILATKSFPHPPIRA
jgi:CRP-like cAMP-binding protein